MALCNNLQNDRDDGSQRKGSDRDQRKSKNELSQLNQASVLQFNTTVPQQVVSQGYRGESF